MPNVSSTYEIRTAKPPRRALTSIWRVAHAAGWMVVTDTDLSGLVSAAGGPDEVKSIGICRPDLARRIYRKQPYAALCMPCNVVLYPEGDQTRMVVLRAREVFPRVFRETPDELLEILEEVDRELQEILLQAAQ